MNPAANASEPPPREVLDAFDLKPQGLARAGAGLINQTWFVRTSTGLPGVLQRVNPVFDPAIHYDIEVVTKHLRSKDVATPTLIPSRLGALWIEHAGAVWRLMSYVDGIAHEALSRQAQAREAGRVLADFHGALLDLEHEFRGARLGVHDTQRHLRLLADALSEHADHPSFPAIRALANEVFELAADIPALPPVPDRIVHGDPKIANILFARTGDAAICLIDLDTVARMPVVLELGDAFRSWCNPKTEDAGSATFSLPLFEAAITGYARQCAGMLEPAEWQSIRAATFTITVELAARFCADALRERYFAWDPRRYASASAHNQARTHGQLNLARIIRGRRDAIDAVVARAFAA